MHNVLLVIHILLALFLIGLVLVQRNEGGGLGIGGGSGMGGLMTGRSAANFLTRTTAILAACFMITSLALTMLVNRESGTGSLTDQLRSVGTPGQIEGGQPEGGAPSATEPAGGQPADAPTTPKVE